MPKLKEYIKSLNFLVKGERLYATRDVERYVNALFVPYHEANRRDINIHNPEYYTSLHFSDEGYRNNNWLVEDISELLSATSGTVLEIGAGNLACSKLLARNVKKVYAVDWADITPEPPMPENLFFRRADVINDDLPNADLSCSADFFEHLPVETIDHVIEKVTRAAKLGWHKIACYDDGHSHLTVMSPLQWLEKFKKI